MREILSIHVGQCGNQIADQFWRLVLKEHQLDENGDPMKGVDPLENAYHQVFFEMDREGRSIPRAVLVDLEPGVISRIEESDLSGLFNTGAIIKRIPGAANNWARGYYVEGQAVIDQIMNVIDEEVEKCKSLQGFMVSHSIGGGSGSGLGSLIVERLRQNYPKQKIFTFSVAPSSLISDSAIEPYNAILTLDKLKENADAVVLLDNEALFRIARSNLQRSPNYMDLNRTISLIMSSITASLRFPGSLNTDLGEFLVNLIPFPGNHFLTASFAPMREPSSKGRTVSFADLANETFRAENFTAAIDFQNGVFLSACALFRGKVTEKEVETVMATIRENLNFCDYVPTGIKLGVSDYSPPGYETSGLAIVNHTGISKVFDRLVAQFDIMYKHEAYTHWYIDGGVTREHMEKARQSVADLSQSYRDAS